MLTIKTFQNTYTPEDAEGILLNCDSKINIAKIEEVYYPYKRVKYNLTLKGRLSKLDKEVNCIIDLIYGRPAVGQGLPAFVEKEIEEGLALEAVIPEEKLYDIGRDFAFKLFLNKSKILNAPTITVEEEESFYKKFFIVQCKDHEEKDYFVMVDSIDGSIAILDWKPQVQEMEAQDEQK